MVLESSRVFLKVASARRIPASSSVTPIRASKSSPISLVTASTLPDSIATPATAAWLRTSAVLSLCRNRSCRICSSADNVIAASVLPRSSVFIPDRVTTCSRVMFVDVISPSRERSPRPRCRRALLASSVSSLCRKSAASPTAWISARIASIFNGSSRSCSAALNPAMRAFASRVSLIPRAPVKRLAPWTAKLAA